VVHKSVGCAAHQPRALRIHKIEQPEAPEQLVEAILRDAHVAELEGVEEHGGDRGHVELERVIVGVGLGR